MESNGAAFAGGLLGASIMMILLFACVFFVVLIIARWKIFTKAGEAGWKSIIPIYSDYIEWRMSWKNMTMFWIMLALLVGGYIILFASGALVAANGTTESTGGGGFFGIIGYIAVLAGAVLGLIQKFKLFKAFGKGVAWFVCYIFFNNIVTLILGFGSAQYQGPQD